MLKQCDFDNHKISCLYLIGLKCRRNVKVADGEGAIKNVNMGRMENRRSSYGLSSVTFPQADKTHWL